MTQSPNADPASTAALLRAVVTSVEALAGALKPALNAPFPGPTQPGGDFDGGVPVAAEGLIDSISLKARELRAELTLASATGGQPAPGEAGGSAAAMQPFVGTWYLTLDQYLSAQMLALAQAREALVHGKRVLLAGTKPVVPQDAPARLDTITIRAS